MIEAAHEIGVHPKTVRNWRRKNPAFQALYNSYCNDFQEAAEVRLLGLGETIVNVLQAHIEAGSFRAAIQVGKGMGLLTGQRRQLTCERAELLAGCDTSPPLQLHASQYPQRESLNGCGQAVATHGYATNGHTVNGHA